VETYIASMVPYWAVVSAHGGRRHQSAGGMRSTQNSLSHPSCFHNNFTQATWHLVRASAVTLITVNEMTVTLCPNSTTILLNCPSPHWFSLTTAFLEPDLPVVIKLFISISTLLLFPLLKIVSLCFDVSSCVDFVYHISRRYGLCKVCSVFNFEFHS